jgi:hypothetical protein
MKDGIGRGCSLFLSWLALPISMRLELQLLLELHLELALLL